MLHWAEQKGAYLIEDDYVSELHYHSIPIQSLQSLDRASRVIYMGTFSKVFSPGLRISYMVLPFPLLERYRAVNQGYFCQVPTVHQKALTKFIAEGYYQKHLNKIRHLYGKKHEAFLRELLLDGYLVRERIVDRAVLESFLTHRQSFRPASFCSMLACIAAELWAQSWTHRALRAVA